MQVLQQLASALFLLTAFGILVTLARTRRLGLLLGAACYGVAGIYALSSGTWWPLLVGFGAAWIVARLGAEPKTDLRLDLPVIGRDEVYTPELVAKYLDWWLLNDNHVRALDSAFMMDAWRNGERYPSFVSESDIGEGTTPEAAWRARTATDLRAFADAPRTAFRSYLDSLACLANRTVLSAFRALHNSGTLPPMPSDRDSIQQALVSSVATAKISSPDEREEYARNVAANCLLSARLRVLAWTFQYWHGERYETSQWAKDSPWAEARKQWLTG